MEWDREAGRVPAGKKGMLLGLLYRSPERTLTDEEVQKAHDRVVAALAQDPSGLVRSVLLFDVYRPTQPTGDIAAGEHSMALRLELLRADASFKGTLRYADARRQQHRAARLERRLQ